MEGVERQYEDSDGDAEKDERIPSCIQSIGPIILEG